jgi:hypothetical protein
VADGRTLYVILTANAAGYRAALRGASRDTREFGDEVDDLGRRIDRGGNEIDRMSGRLRLMLDAFTLIGPASIPIAAIAVPAIAGLANMLGVAALAGGSAMLAFQGVGDVLKAVEKVRLEPTAANLAELHQLMSDLQPAARAFVQELDTMMPLLDSIQDAAADGFFPGATEGLSDLRSMIPVVRRMVGEYADSLGDLAAEQADAFDSARGKEFIRFLSAEARPTLSDIFGIASNLAAGLGELWMAFDPLNDDFSDWMLDAARSFDVWATGLDQTEGFTEFVDYIRDNGPQVAATFGAIATMLLNVVEAAAPMGGPVLQGIEMFANAISAIADSPIGPTLIAAAVAATALNRGLQVTQGLLTRIGVQSAASGAGGMMSAISGKASSARSGVTSLRSDLSSMRGEYQRLGAAQAIVTSGLSNTSGAAQRARSALGGYARAAGTGAAAAGALALVSTESGRSLGLTNTAMLGLVGSMMGPWGAAAGATIGALLDIKAAGDEVRDSVDAMHDALSDGNLMAYADAAKAARGSLSDLENTSGIGDALADAPQRIGLAFQETFSGNLWGGITDGLQEEVQAAEAEFDNLRLALETISGESGQSMDQMAQSLARSKPAMDALGITVEDLADAAADGSILQMADQLNAWQSHADSASGRTEAFASTVADLGNEALSTAESAGAMGAALEALLSPTLSAEEATDAWRASLQTLRAELQSGAGFAGFGEAAMKNREITRDYANTAIERLSALAEVSTTTETQMARAVAQTRSEFIKNGIAAGISREAIVRRANAMGLTPKLVQTVFKAAGVTESELKVRRLRVAFKSLPPRAQTEIRATRIPQTSAEIDRLVKKYQLTEKQRRALVTLKDAASPGIRTIQALLNKAGSTNARPTISLRDYATAQLNRALAAIRNLDGETATVTTVMRSVRVGPGGQGAGFTNANGGIYSAGARQFADGGYGRNGRYYTRTPQIVEGGANILWGEEETGWEAYISGKPGQRERNVKILGVAAERFGYEIIPAANGRIGSEHVSRAGSRSATVVVRDRMPSRMELLVDGHRFTAYVRQHAEDVAGQKIEAVNNAEVATDRRDW